MWQWILVLGVAYAVWRLSQPSGDCTIRIRNGQLSIRGKLPAGRRAQIEQFLTQEFPEIRRLRIDIHYRDRGRPLRIRIRGTTTDGQRQQIRNFLTTAL